VGQEHVARTLQNAVRKGRVAHAYLFCGSRGIGKTSMARILAASLNCKDGPTPEPCGECESCRKISTGDDIDVMEIDGASNRGIDEIRELRQNSKFAPAHSRFKIYYVDEVHMLTTPAFNALLKTLEEPPRHVKFIFSTTDPQQVPETVKSRCQRFDFRRISDADIIKHLRVICEKEGLDWGKGALEAIARAARGGMRDALGTLDQVAAVGDGQVSLDDVLTVLGAVRTQTIEDITAALGRGETGEALKKIDDVLFSGVDILDFCDQFSAYLRDLLMVRYCESDDKLLAGSVAGRETLQEQSALFSAEQIIYMIQMLREASLRARRDTTGRLALELAIIKMSRLEDLVDIQQAIDSFEKPDGPSVSAPFSKKTDNGSGGSQQGAENANSSHSAHPSLRIKSMMQKLQGGKTGKKKRKNDSDEAAVDNSMAPPDGMDGTTFRQIQRVATQNSLIPRLKENEPLLKAFREARETLGMQPVALEKLELKEEDEEVEEDDSL
jgi:DNA polymerase-3 subunit gamma/tau